MIHIFCPFRTYSSPFFSAFVLIPLTSEPAPGSVTAYAYNSHMKVWCERVIYNNTFVDTYSHDWLFDQTSQVLFLLLMVAGSNHRCLLAIGKNVRNKRTPHSNFNSHQSTYSQRSALNGQRSAGARERQLLQNQATVEYR